MSCPSGRSNGRAQPKRRGSHPDRRAIADYQARLDWLFQNIVDGAENGIEQNIRCSFDEPGAAAAKVQRSQLMDEDDTRRGRAAILKRYRKTGVSCSHTTGRHGTDPRQLVFVELRGGDNQSRAASRLFSSPRWLEVDEINVSALHRFSPFLPVSRFCLQSFRA